MKLLLATATLKLYRDGRVFVRDVDTETQFIPGYVLGSFYGIDATEFLARPGRSLRLVDPDEFETVAQAWEAHNEDAEDPLAAVAEWNHHYLSSRGI